MTQQGPHGSRPADASGLDRPRVGPDRPTPDNDTQAWWDALETDRLTVNRCSTCAHASLFIRPFCPRCWSEDVALEDSSGRGTLYTWSEVHSNGPPFSDDVPYIAAVVELAEGPRLMTTLVNADVATLCADLPVRVVFADRGDGLRVPVFEPA